MKPIYLKGLSIFTMQFILGCSVVTASTSIEHIDLQTQVSLETSTQMSTQNNTQAAPYGAMQSVARAGIPSGNLMLPGATTTTSSVEKTPVYKLTNFPEMRRGLEKLFDSFVTETGGSGPLYTSQVYKYGTSLIDEETSKPNFSGFLGTKYSQQYLAKQDMTQELANLAKYTLRMLKAQSGMQV